MINDKKHEEQKKWGIYDWICTFCEQNIESEVTPRHCPYCLDKYLLKPDLPAELLEKIGYEYLLFDDDVPEHQILLFELLSIFYNGYGMDWMVERVVRIREQTKILRIKFELPNPPIHLPPDRSD